ncbi:MAG: Fic family protein [Oscillospiraceae bacterium]|nr:Fic family protein [Oscillospiraceae bacterium]
MSDYEKIIKLWQKWAVKSESDIDMRLENFRILFAYNSGKIENADITYHNTREIFENGRVINYTGDPRAIFETQNQRLCYEYLKPKLAAKEPLSIELVKDIHNILTSGTYDDRRYIAQNERPGEFKKHDYVTGLAEVGSPPEYVEQDMADLIFELNNLSSEDKAKDKFALKAAAYFHVRFENIHPFADGNGRTGRTLMNYELMLNDHPPLIIYEEDKQFYYNALEQYDNNEEVAPMVDFLESQLTKTWGKTLQREQ